MPLETIGRNIRRHRQAKRMTIEDLAESAGLSKNYVAMVERSEKIPSVPTLLKIINALNVSADEILCGVTIVGYRVRSTELSNRMENVSPARRDMIFSLLEILLKEDT